MPDKPTNPSLTLKAFQNLIRDRYFQTDHARGTPSTFMWFVEEVGELATALQQVSGHDKQSSETPDLEGEFADVLAWLCTLANINNVDLSAAVQAKYMAPDQPTGHK